MSNIDGYNSSGSDGIRPRLLRQCAERLVSQLSRLYKASFLTGRTEIRPEWSLY